MQPTTWKRLLSYLMEFHIESAPSSINPHLYVSLKNGRYQLCTARAVYSYGDLYSNFRKTFQQIDLDRLPGKRVLLLGLGLGSVPYMLEKVFSKKYVYTGVELDESVIYLMSKYVLPELESPIELLQTHALTYVQQTNERFDLIAMDIFLDDVVPAEFESHTFLQALKSLLNEGGLLCYNRLYAKQSDRIKTKNFYEQAFLPNFPEGTYLDVGGNWMLLNRKDVVAP